MKKTLIFIFTLTISLNGIAHKKNKKIEFPIPIEKKWKDYNPGYVNFKDKSPESEGSKIYHTIIKNPEPYIQENAIRVLQTLYDNPQDKNIPKLKVIHYIIKDYDGISEENGHGNQVRILYSTRWIEQSFANNDTAKVDYETRGVLYHELTHAYQLNPKNCGTYEDGGEYWCFIEGMADAVRLACGCFEQDFQSNDRPRGGTWRSGYRITGYFLFWLQQNKDKNFLKKFNHSAVELETWSWDAAMKHVLGNRPENGVDALWNEYLKAISKKN